MTKRVLSFLLVFILAFTVFPIQNVKAETITETQVKSKFNALMTKYGFKPGEYDSKKNDKEKYIGSVPSMYINGTQCFGFVDLVTNKLFGHGIYSYDSTKYRLVGYGENLVQVGKTLTYSGSTTTPAKIKELFSQAKCGDIVQMRYTKLKWDTGEQNGSSNHTMTVYSVSDSGIIFYHSADSKNIYFGKADNKNPIYGYSKKELSWQDFAKYFANSGDGVSLYRSKKVVDGVKYDVVDFSTVSTYSKDYDMTISIFGKDGCYNSEIVLNNIVKSGLDKEDKIRILFIDVEQRTKQKLATMSSPYKKSNIIFCYDTSYNANATMWSYVKGTSFKKSITTPLIVFTKSDGTVFRVTQGLMDADYIGQLAKQDVSGEEIVKISVSGKEKYSYSFEVLNQLNKLRKNLNVGTLKMDADLMEAAMQRAAELSISYSHTRPNGKDAFSVLDGMGGQHGENIAMGQPNATYVMNSWKNSKGHYANMTNSKFLSAGIGCFETSEGRLCWVQLFSTEQPSVVEKTGTIKSKHNIDIQKRLLDIEFSIDKNLHTLSKGKTAKITVTNTNNYVTSKQVIDSSSFNYSSSNSKIVEVNSSGKCTVKGSGTVKITVTPKSTKSIKKTKKYTVGHTYTNSCDKTCNFCDATREIKHKYNTTLTKATKSKNGSIVKKCSVCSKKTKKTIKQIDSIKLSKTTYTYNGNVQKPKVKIKNSDGKMISSEYYTVTYAKGRKNVGSYKVTIKMKGNYSGTKTLTFKINPPKTSVSKLSAGNKSISVSISKKTSQVTGYQIKYSTSKKFKNAKIKTLESNKKTKYTIKNLKAKNTYYIRVRTYKTVKGKKYYSEWSSYKATKPKNKVIIKNVPIISQFPKYPTGCESVSAVMALKHSGCNISVKEFVNDYLPTENEFYYKNGKLCGPSPYECFVGNPKSNYSYGCMAPVLQKAITKCVGKSAKVKSLKNYTVKEICKKYIDKGTPAIVWATIDMKKVKRVNSWYFKNGKRFTWPGNEHCLVLVGYDDKYYYFNDPNKGKQVSYKKSLVEKRFNQLGRQALVIQAK